MRAESLREARVQSMRWLAIGFGCVALAASSLGNAQDADEDADRAAGGHEGGELGGPLPGIDPEEFERVRAEFLKVKGPGEGLGPIYNGEACGNCHFLGAAGGAGLQTVHRVGRYVNGVFDGLVPLGGSLMQAETLGVWTNKDGVQCDVPAELPPAETEIDTDRLTPQLFGLGLVDSLPNSFFVDLAASQPAETRGIAKRGQITLPDPRDPEQVAGGERVARFSWKGVIPSVIQFAAGAYLNEMGVTSSHCVRGQRITAFTTEPAPNGVPVDAACADDIPGIDRDVGTCAAGETKIHPLVDDFTTFITFLAPPRPVHGIRELGGSNHYDEYAESERSASDRRTYRRGFELFEQVGCASCHAWQGFTTPTEPFNGVPGNMKFYPFSDFLSHDMGKMGDDVGNNGETPEQARLMRTAPLWGIRHRARLLHDGSVSDVPSAIRAHKGQGAAARERFKQLTSGERSALVRFVNSL